MRIKKYYITLIFLLFCVVVTYAQDRRTEFLVDFRVNSTVIDSTYSDNAVRMQGIIDFLHNICRDSTINIVEVSFCGAASPEGSDQLNRRLARGRLTALENLVRKEVDIPDSLITRNDSYIPWNYLKKQIEDSDIIRTDEVIAILNESSLLVDYHYPNLHIDSRIVKLQKLDNGKVWQQINKLFFGQMRNASVVFITYKRELPAVQEPIIVQDTVVAEPFTEITPDTTAIVETIVPKIEEWNHKLYLKTNALFWGMGMTNVSAEIDLAKHWSFALPVTYSAWNYFTSTVKFRTLAVQPEFRYWFNENNQKFFIGAHFGYAQYNVAVDGDYRYQDHGGKSPALGGGISVGYRMPISKNDKWHIEFTLGAGGYSLHYDKFYNVNNGKLIDTYRKTYWGIDNAAINISYRFDLKKRKK